MSVCSPAFCPCQVTDEQFDVKIKWEVMYASTLPIKENSDDWVGMVEKTIPQWQLISDLSVLHFAFLGTMSNV